MTDQRFGPPDIEAFVRLVYDEPRRPSTIATALGLLLEQVERRAVEQERLRLIAECIEEAERIERLAEHGYADYDDDEQKDRLRARDRARALEWRSMTVALHLQLKLAHLTR